MNTKATALLIIVLLVGLGVGYALGFVAPATSTTVTTTVNGGGGTVTTTMTTTMTITSGGQTGTGGLSGTILIGNLAPVSYSAWPPGAIAPRADQIAINDINAWLKANNAGWQLQLVVEDDAGDPTTALNKMQLLSAQGVKVVLGPEFSSQASAILPYANSHDMVLISHSTADNLAIANDYLFRSQPVNGLQITGLVKVLQNAGVKAVDGLYIASGACPDWLTSMTNQSTAVGITNRGITFDANTADFSTQVSQLNSQVQSDVSQYGAAHVAVFHCGFEDLIPIVTQAQQYPVLSQVNWYDQNGVALDSKIAVGTGGTFAAKVNLTATNFGASITPMYKTVGAELAAQLGPAANNIYSIQSYDDTWLAALGIMAAGTYSGQAVYNVISSVSQHDYGATGPMALNQFGDRAYGVLPLDRVIRYTNGTVGWAQVGTFDSLTSTVTYTAPTAP